MGSRCQILAYDGKSKCTIWDKDVFSWFGTKLKICYSGLELSSRCPFPAFIRNNSMQGRVGTAWAHFWSSFQGHLALTVNVPPSALHLFLVASCAYNQRGFRFLFRNLFFPFLKLLFLLVMTFCSAENFMKNSAARVLMKNSVLLVFDEIFSRLKKEQSWEVPWREN